jgi:IS5 family transposase
MNALLCGADHNLRKILCCLALLCAQILECLQHFIQKPAANNQRLLMAIC